MFTDARMLAHGTVLSAPVAVIGGGPAGITVAAELATAGIESVVLEAGDLHGGGGQRFVRGESVGATYNPVHGTRVRGFAGTSRHWGGNGPFRGRRLDPLDFESRPGFPYHGWPLTASDLEPYYRRAHEWCDLGQDVYDVDRWATAERPVLDLVAGPLAHSVFKLTAADTWTRRRSWFLALPTVRTLFNAEVMTLETSAGGDRIDRLRCTTTTGVDFTVVAETVVLAAGGIENARLLLLNDERHPAGLGNEHDLVGRFFMEHPAARTGVVHLRDRAPLERLGLYERHPSPEGAPHQVQAKLTLTEAVLRDRQLLNGVFFLHARSLSAADPAIRAVQELKRAVTGHRPVLDDPAAHVAAAVRGAPALIRAAAERARGTTRHDVISLMAMWEQEPNPESRVTLGRSRDPLGRRRCRLDWRLTARDVGHIRVHQQIVDGHLRTCGLGHVDDLLGDEQPRARLRGSWHHIGTTRMDPDPTRGVVDAQCRVHAIDNLYVAGSSVFPTGGYANPTLTLVALAVRLADHLRSRA